MRGSLKAISRILGLRLDLREVELGLLSWVCRTELVFKRAAATTTTTAVATTTATQATGMLFF